MTRGHSLGSCPSVGTSTVDYNRNSTNSSIDFDEDEKGSLLGPSFFPVGPREPESLHSWSWLTSKGQGLVYLLNERLREVSREEPNLQLHLSYFACWLHKLTPLTKKEEAV